jgi:hypothetical protein
MTEAPPTVSYPSHSIDRAFELLDNGEPHATCELLNTAVRTDRITLFADGAKVDAAFFTTHLVITAAEGTAKVTARSALDRSDYEWTISGIEKLLSPLPVTRWLDAEIKRMKESGQLKILIGKSAIARDIAPRMETAADRGEVEHALSVNRIRNLLPLRF